MNKCNVCNGPPSILIFVDSVCFFSLRQKLWSFQISISITLASARESLRPAVRFGPRGTAYASWAYVFTIVGAYTEISLRLTYVSTFFRQFGIDLV